MKYILLIALLLVGACKDTQADRDSDVGLYDPVAPEGSAFVRFTNVADKAVDTFIDRKRYDNVDTGQMSAYYVAPQGVRNISAPYIDISKDIVEGKFYTVVSSETPIILEDTANTDRAKATIALYNLSSIEGISLKAKNGTVDVLKDVAKNATKARDMNAVKIDFSIYKGDKLLTELDEAVLERGNHYSVIFYSGGAYSAKMVTATTNTRK